MKRTRWLSGSAVLKSMKAFSFYGIGKDSLNMHTVERLQVDSEGRWRTISVLGFKRSCQVAGVSFQGNIMVFGGLAGINEKAMYKLNE